MLLPVNLNEPFEINVNITLKELQKFHLRPFTKTISGKIVMGIVGFMGVIGLILFLVTLDLKNLTNLIVPFTAFFVFPYFINRQVKKIYIAHEERFKNTTYTFTDSELLSKTPKDSSRQLWKDCHKLLVEKENILLFPNKINAYIFPKRLFANEQEIEKFVIYLKQKIN